jgi:hypothetical protein
MKYATLKTFSIIAIVSLTSLTGACGSVAAAQPPTQVVVVTATPAPQSASTAVKVSVVAEEEPVAASSPLEAGPVVQEDAEALFQLTHEGNLQQAAETAETGPAAKDAPGEVTPEDGPLAEIKAEGQTGEVTVHLNSQIEAANLRKGPGVGYDVVKVIQSGDDLITVHARTTEGWLQVTHEGDEGWLAANLVEPNALLSTLPVVEPPAAAPEAPAPPVIVEEKALQPIFCYETPIRGFGKVWGAHLEVQNGLNCPSQFQEQGTNAAIQQFQNGLMLWLESDTVYSADPVYVFFNDGTYQRFGDLGPADPAKMEQLPAGFFEVGDKFSKVYWEGTGARVKERLGYPTTQAIDSPGAFQQFYNGRMFWAGAIDRIFVIYDYYIYENDQSIHITGWEMYEDTF